MADIPVPTKRLPVGVGLSIGGLISGLLWLAIGLAGLLIKIYH